MLAWFFTKERCEHPINLSTFPALSPTSLVLLSVGSTLDHHQQVLCWESWDLLRYRRGINLVLIAGPLPPASNLCSIRRSSQFSSTYTERYVACGGVVLCRLLSPMAAVMRIRSFDLADTTQSSNPEGCLVMSNELAFVVCLLCLTCWRCWLIWWWKEEVQKRKKSNEVYYWLDCKSSRLGLFSVFLSSWRSRCFMGHMSALLLRL